MPKLTSISYYQAVKTGVMAAADELPELEVNWIGPAQAKVGMQSALLERELDLPAAQRPAVIAVAANDARIIDPVLKRARAAGVHVMSWDADAPEREFFVNLVDYDAFGAALVDALIEEAGDQARYAIVTTTFESPNQVAWIRAMRRHLAAHHPQVRLADMRAAGESTEEAMRVAHDFMQRFPDLDAIVALGVPNVPGVAQAVREAGRRGRVAVLGNSTPNLVREFIDDGTVRQALLWNPMDHGYLTVYCARQLLKGDLRAGQPFTAGRLGAQTPRADDVNLQVSLPVLTFTAQNVDHFSF